MANKVLSSILALAGNKAAALQAATDDVKTSAKRGILHNDYALLSDTAKELAAQGGQTKDGVQAKSSKGDILGRVLAALHSIRAERSAQYPEGRKGKATAEQEAAAETAAAQIAADFKAACEADAKARTDANKQRAADGKAKREADAAAKVSSEAPAPTPAAVEASDNDPIVIPQWLELVEDGGVLVALTIDGQEVTLDALRYIVAEHYTRAAELAIAADAQQATA